MFTKLLVFIVVLTLTTAAGAQDVDFTVTCFDDRFCIALDQLPQGISTGQLHCLFGYLQQHVQPHPDSDLADYTSEFFILVQFVEPQATGHFPYTTEGYGGMIGLARWECEPQSSATHGRTFGCLITPEAGEQFQPETHVVLALIQRTVHPKENLGLAAHELTHYFGAVDGKRCPINEDYEPRLLSVTDPGDACWWYGVQGVFDLHPAGIVWQALNGECQSSSDRQMCEALATALNVDSEPAVGQLEYDFR